MPEESSQRKRLIALLTVFGFAVTVFGSVIFVLPVVIESSLAHAGCGDNCIPSIPSFNAYYVRALVTLIIVVVAGFLPLILYLLVNCRHGGKE